MIVLKTNNLTKIYRKRHLGKLYANLAVNNINLEVKENEIYGLIGLNGSGKTTTIKLILGLLFPTSGEIFVFGQKMPNRNMLSKIGYLPETPYFQRYLTGKEILNFYCQLTKIEFADIRIKEVTEIVQLGENINKRINEYSKGMLQRLAIAQSLLHNPSLLIFDEPVSGLDPVGIREIRNFIKLMKSQGKTIFFSSHLISEVEKICDRVGILHKGELKRVIDHKEWELKSLEEIFLETIEK
jgi:ABC-2 type transport system ATP-binding protein